MELVYLWVEKYKNIEKQGFNFSPRFDCKFDGENLTIEEKKYTSIFPDNINITAIVGENGSGKSTIFECLSFMLIDNKLANYKNDLKFFLICKDNNEDLKLYLHSHLMVKDKNNKLKNQIILNNENILSQYKYIFSLLLQNNQTNNNLLKGIDNSSEQSVPCDGKLLDKEAIVSIIKNYNHKSKFKFLKESKHFFVAEKVRIHVMGTFVGVENKKDKEIKGILLKKDYNKCLEILKVPLKIIDDEKANNSSFFVKQFNGINKNYKSYDIPIENLKIEDIDVLLKEDKLLVELIDNNDISYNNLSYGEQQLLKQLHLILNKIENTETNTFSHEHESESIKIEKYFLFLDEFEIGLHPNWQKKALNYIIDFIDILNIKVDLFITSHSPFILSDLPKENVIFLKDGKQEYPFKDKQTFGANIHTLLSDGFFMNDGLMGEFAKGKIEEIKKFYEKVKDDKNSKINHKKEYDDNIKNFRHIQSIIGEPFLQTVIKNYLDELEILFNGKNQFLDDEIKRLQDLRDNS